MMSNIAIWQYIAIHSKAICNTVLTHIVASLFHVALIFMDSVGFQHSSKFYPALSTLSIKFCSKTCASGEFVKFHLTQFKAFQIVYGMHLDNNLRIFINYIILYTC